MKSGFSPKPGSSSNSEVATTMTKAPENRPKGGRLAMHTPPIVSPQEWEAAREQLLVKEKAQMRARDTLAAERRRMPWMAVKKAYEFEGPKGTVSLLDLFEGRRQLIVYRAFFEPGVFGWPEHACRGCSLRGRSGRPPRPPERPRHHPRIRLARAAGGHRPPEGADGLEDAVVHYHRQLRRRLRRRSSGMAITCSSATASVFAPTSSTAAATRRWGPPGAISI